MASHLPIVALLTFVTFCCASTQPARFTSELELLAHEEFKMIVNSVASARIDYKIPRKRPTVGKFVYKNCADPSKESFVVSSLDVKPDPIKLPGTVNVSVESEIKAEFGKPLSMKLEVKKEILGFWVKVPCVDDVGSCTYDDLCAGLAKLFETCPPVLVKQGFNCRCPFTTGKMSLNGMSLKFDASLPSEASGELRMKLELFSGKKFITCMDVDINVA